MTIRHVHGHATATDVCSGRIARKDAEMNQRADRLADKGADLGAPYRLALTLFQDNAKFGGGCTKNGCQTRGRTRPLGRDCSRSSQFKYGSPERSRICKANNGTDLLLRHQRVTAASRIRKCRSRFSRCNPLTGMWLRTTRPHPGQEPLPCKWNFPRLCEIEKAPQLKPIVQMVVTLVL